MVNGDVMTARALGLFSVGLGLAQLVVPRTVAELIGTRGGGRTSQVVMRVLGLREMAAGLGLLTQRRPSGWVWARVAGDAMDLALLGAALVSPGNQRQRLSAAIAAVGGVTVADLQSAQLLSQADGSVQFSKAVTINRTPEAVYAFWRDFRNLPRFMSQLESVSIASDTHSHWRASGGGGTMEWDAEITVDRPNQLIVWRSLSGADVDHHGTVRFTPGPGGRGTEVRLEMSYTAPAGGLGVTIARLVQRAPRQQLQADFRKLKELLETGHVVRSSPRPEASMAS